MFENILLVDDDPITLMLCKKVFSRTSFSNTVITAQNGEEAISFFKKLNKNTESENLPELIFLDLNMPVMGGWEFLDEFSNKRYERFHQIKIVVLSSTIDPEDLAKTKDYPMIIDFLPKPITLNMLNNLNDKIQP